MGKELETALILLLLAKQMLESQVLLITIAKREIAIVTEEPGTTRDILESFIDFRGYPIKIFDTAGIRKTNNKVEKIGYQQII